jgi:ribosome biogenesis GTPase A
MIVDCARQKRLLYKTRTAHGIIPSFDFTHDTMPIQWFPGHMVSARKKAAEAMAFTDVVIEVVDARLPEASTNPLVHELRRQRQRPCLKVLNKSDLADPAATREWIVWYDRQPGVKAVAVSSKNPGEAARLPGLCQGLAPHRDDNTKPLRMMIMGIPNVGKSTLMNTLAGYRIARVGDEPAVTKSQQSRQIGARQWITDTPGLMWPKIEHDADGYMLAASHAIGRNAVLEEEVAVFLADLLLRRYPERLAERYGFALEGADGVAVVEGVARRRALRMRSGEPDREKAALALLQDYRDGRLGRISLETPETRRTMLEHTGGGPAVQQ